MKNHKQKFSPILMLFLLSPIIAELFSGSTPVSRAEQLIMESFFYGPAVLLIREFVRRYKMGWFAVILLGYAFGIFEESLLLQSTFNPHFLNFDIGYGRFWGVNWIWSEIIIVNHSIWSITIPILIAEQFFPEKRSLPWLSKTGIVIFAFLLFLSSYGFYAIFFKMSGFSASWIHRLVAVLAAVAVVFAAIRLSGKSIVNYQIKTPSPIFTGIISWIISLGWLNLLSLVFIKDPVVPAWLTGLTGLLILCLMFFLVQGWINSNWNDLNRFSLACGAIYAGLSFGLIILIPTGNKLDIIFQTGFILIVSLLLIFYRKNLFRE